MSQNSSSLSNNMVNPKVFASLFSGFNNCNVTISPQNVIVNVGTSVSSEPSVSNFLDGISLEQFLW